SFGIIFLNFMPETMRSFFFYTAAWVLFSVLFEIVTVKVDFINYISWKWWYSIFYYFAAFFFLRWHLHFIRSYYGFLLLPEARSTSLFLSILLSNNFLASCFSILLILLSIFIFITTIEIRCEKVSVPVRVSVKK